MSRMEIPANGHPIVRPEHFIDIETGIRKTAGNILIVAIGALEASARRLVTEIDIIIGNDLIQDSGVLVVVGIVKTLNHVEIRLWLVHRDLPRNRRLTRDRVAESRKASKGRI